MRCLIDGITHRGEGVARINGKATFIPFAIPGEEVDIKITMERPRFSKGEITEIIAASPDRVNPPCEHYYQCGGCAYQHVHYERQLQLKKQVVIDAIKRIGKQVAVVNDVIGMEDPWYYRNKVTWHTGEIKGEKRLGYYQLDSRRHLPISDCLIISPEIKKFSQFLDCYLDVTGINSGQQVMIRHDSQGKLYLIVEGPVNKESLKSLVKGYPGLESLFIYQDQKLNYIFGSDKLEFIIGERQYRVSPLAFFQVNNEQTKRLYDEVKKAATIKGGRRILDAYCGTGSIAIYAADENESVVGVDEFGPSIQDARINASLNHMSNCEFIAGACEKVLPSLKQDFDMVILDPPRAGCHQDLIHAIIEQKIPQIIYVSCNPATLARDIKILADSAYRIESVQPVDMFPWTSHVETVVLMSRVKVNTMF
jgi:23S rRNA (uracil1939-C5)-methyltransferase